MQIRTSIERKLTDALSPILLRVEDESHRHAKHGNQHPDGETHFNIAVISAAFSGKSRIERHRMIHSLLAEELSSRVHALRLSIKTPDEA